MCSGCGVSPHTKQQRDSCSGCGVSPHTKRQSDSCDVRHVAHYTKRIHHNRNRERQNTSKMNFTKHSISLMTALAAMTMGSASCSSDDGSDDTDMRMGYVSVRVTVDGTAAGATRTAGPEGDEDGDGRELATAQECKVNNITVLLYRNTTSGGTLTDAINADVKVEKTLHFTSGEFTTQLGTAQPTDNTATTAARKCDLELIGDNKCQLIVIANDRHTNPDTYYNNKTLKEIADEIATSQWDGTDVSTATNFLMSSESVASTSGAKGSGTQADPVVVEAKIERLAARIDIVPNSTAWDATSHTYGYNVYNKKAGTFVIGGFVLEKVAPINCLSSGAYMLKRLTDGSSSSTTETYLLDEDATKYYVVCPWMETSATGLTFTNAYDDFSWPTTGYEMQSVTGSDGYYTLAYVEENTSYDNDDERATGLIFKGKIYDAADWDATNLKPMSGATGKGTDKEYVYYLRHSDPSGTGTQADKMYYGVVRNNIYRVKIDKVVGDGLMFELKVKPWKTYTHKTLYM